MPTLSIHIKTTGAGLIKEPCILISYYNEDWGVLQRMLNHRNIEKQFVLKRFATNEEMSIESHPYRVGFLVYRNWDKLINDEMKYTDDKMYLSTLENLKNSYPQFNSNQIEIPL